MIKAIPIGRNNISLTALPMMKMIPLIAKSIAAVLNDFEFSDDLLLITKALSQIDTTTILALT